MTRSDAWSLAHFRQSKSILARVAGGNEMRDPN